MTDEPTSSIVASDDGRHDRQTLMLLRRAIASGWDIPEIVMTAAPKVAAQILTTGSARDKLRAMDVLTRMRESNIAAIQVLDKVERLEGGSPTEIYTVMPIVL